VIKLLVCLTAFIAGALTLYVWQNARLLEESDGRTVNIVGLTDLQCFDSSRPAPHMRFVLAAGIVDLILIIFVAAFVSGPA
jgi:hypothetical protein